MKKNNIKNKINKKQFIKGKNTISVVIPTLNEEKTIGKIVQFIKTSPFVKEIIVVDDKSIDNTIQEAKKLGANIFISTKRGKGRSMRDGFSIARNEIIVFLDGDIEQYPPKTIEKLTLPIINNKADFVKGSFKRKAGRITELVAKPLVSLLFPTINNFNQPLSGIIAGKKKFFKKIIFEDDYGVDIGILLDMALLGAKIKEVNIGTIQHKMKQWHQLKNMSKEVTTAILKRAAAKSLIDLDSLETINVIGNQMELAINKTLSSLKKMIIFDMDNTILNGKFIEKAALKFGFQNDYINVKIKNQESYFLTKSIAKFFKGKNISELISVADEIPLVSDAIDVIKKLKKRGYIVGIVSNSYDCIANHIKNKIDADFALANELEFSRRIATGEVKIPSFFLKTKESKCNHNICKSNAMIQLSKKYNIPLSNIIAVGDNEHDICMVKFSGIGIAFCSNNNILKFVADQQINKKSFKQILGFAI